MKSLLVLGCLLALVSTGCGKKGAPRAPELAMPQPIKNLTAKPDRSGIVLTWSRPTEYIDGKPLTDLTGFIIFRKDLSPACPECPVPYRPLTTVNVEDREKFVKQKQYRLLDENAQAQVIYRYRVSSQLKDGSLSEASNEVQATRGP
jgi:hypothetical protein